MNDCQTIRRVLLLDRISESSNREVRHAPRVRRDVLWRWLARRQLSVVAGRRPGSCECSVVALFALSFGFDRFGRCCWQHSRRRSSCHLLRINRDFGLKHWGDTRGARHNSGRDVFTADEAARRFVRFYILRTHGAAVHDVGLGRFEQPFVAQSADNRLRDFLRELLPKLLRPTRFGCLCGKLLHRRSGSRPRENRRRCRRLRQFWNRCRRVDAFKASGVFNRCGCPVGDTLQVVRNCFAPNDRLRRASFKHASKRRAWFTNSSRAPSRHRAMRCCS